MRLKVATKLTTPMLIGSTIHGGFNTERRIRNDKTE